MFINQQILTEKALFDFYMVSSTMENQVYSTFPFYLSKEVYEDMVQGTLILDRIVNRFLTKVLNEKTFVLLPLDDFDAKGEIIDLGISLPPFFWARYDVFERENGGIFFSEFNYDKPCAQREMAMSDMMKPHNNPNEDFIRNFREGFKKLWEDYSGGTSNPTVAIVMDPGHYEELHLAYLYMDMLKPLGCNFIVAGAGNLYIQNDCAMAFDQKIDIILRQFPTEFSNEINNYKEILKLYDKGRLLLLNDPRAVIIQAKSLFAALWKMVEENSDFLTELEKNTIREKLPYTVIFNTQMEEELRKNKDKYVIKASFGRYSEEVYIGNMHSSEEWEETLEFVKKSEKIHIVQEFCQIKKQRVLKYNGNHYEEADAFGNFGLYMVNGEYSGVSVRFSPDYLSLDENVWVSAVGVSDRNLKTVGYDKPDKAQKWEAVNDYAAFEHGYTGGYTSWYKSFSLDCLLIQRDLYKELAEATEKLASIFKKARNYVLENLDIICPVLGISDNLINLLKNERTENLTLVGRFDWVMDTRGNLRILELNSETPAGMMESLVLSSQIKKYLELSEQDPNRQMSELLRSNFTDILEDYKKAGKIKNIGFVSSSFAEDWYNTSVLMNLFQDLPYEFVLGEVSGLKAENNKIKLYGHELDAVYRYYPLDWFDKDSYFDGAINAMKKGTVSINPPSTIICQSKAFLALIFELKNSNFFNQSECCAIEKYIPETYLVPKKSLNGIFCAKPYFEREGKSVAFSFRQPFLSRDIKDYIYQEWVDIQSIRLDIETAINSSREIVYPVIGAYIIGDKFGGIYTRMGSSVTNRWAVYLPSYIENI
ncbi:MAG: hypothetical protein K0R50_605 [Eubacterium sp.]|jgi:glutathionylspermidine synthase|nr:hypothetical protein [Eubacterium sp.]